ncbi:MAG: ABC transporter permease [Candidatus Bathyarchaeia archaeon]|jgi:peptide/nickel transport system permease protein
MNEKADRAHGTESETQARIAELKYSLHQMRQNPLVLAGLILVVFFTAVAAVATLLVSNDEAFMFDFGQSYCWSNAVFSWTQLEATCPPGTNFILGTDGFGRDLLRMIILSIPLDLKIAFLIVAAASAFGVALGAIAAWIGGKFDEAILRITDVFFAFPGLVLALVFAALFGRTVQTLTLAVLLVWWPTYVRLTRGQVLVEKEKTYAEALKSIGVSPARIVLFHIIPNAIYPIIVQMTLDIGGVILTFSALIFLGFSPSPALPELGNLAADGINHVFTAPWLIVFPGLTILLIALAFNLMGDGLRDILDPRLRR